MDKDAPVSKRAKKEQDIKEAFKVLQDKHSEEYSSPQLCIWARMYGNGLHDDLDDPPNVTAITGQPIKKRRKQSMNHLKKLLLVLQKP